MQVKSTGKSCVVCGGDIMERSFIPYIPMISAAMCGDGSRNIATEKNRQVDGLHCDRCGLTYHQLPKIKSGEVLLLTPVTTTAVS